MKKTTVASEEKLSHKVFLQNIIISTVGILLCIVALCSMTYAWFTNSTANAGNTLVAGSFDLTVTVEDGEAQPLTLTHLEDGSFAVTLPEGTYRVTLTMTDDTTVSRGYCLLSANGATYATAGISLDGNHPFSFLLTVTEEISVTFKPAWGTPADHHVTANGTLVLGAPPTAGN